MNSTLYTLIRNRVSPIISYSIEVVMILFDNEYFMRKALMQAQYAADEEEVPVGAVAVQNNTIIASAYNQVEKLNDATAHAEILVITQAAAHLGDWRLNDVDIYVTKEPCAMCAGAMVNSRIRQLFFGMPDPRSGCAGSAIDITSFPGMLHSVKVTGRVLEDECRTIIQEFFQKKRASTE